MYTCTVVLLEVPPPLFILPVLCCSSQYGDMLHDTERVSLGLQGSECAVCRDTGQTECVLLACIRCAVVGRLSAVSCGVV